MMDLPGGRPTMQTPDAFSEGKLLRIFVDDYDRSGATPTYSAVIEFLRRRGISGATAFRGIEGYGVHRDIHVGKLFSLHPNLPILVEAVDDWSKIEPLLPELRELVGEGFMT